MLLLYPSYFPLIIFKTVFRAYLLTFGDKFLILYRQIQNEHTSG